MTQPDVTIGKQQVDDVGFCQSLKPTENDFKGMPGYFQKEKPGGGYEWGVDYKSNEGGKLTQQAEEVREAMTPHWRADTERVRNLNGFAHEPRMRVKGERTMVSRPDGSLWRRGKVGWERVL